MKKLLITTLFICLAMADAASASQQINNTYGKEKIGTVSASNAWTLEDLSDELSRKADEKGATSYKILSTSGNNLLHGDADIYK
ncbi:DUF1471 domain-containing protein [Rahnella sp. PCH160]|uniref:DUF1471 domain-containing protein n=1 Tax=Rahnella sp. PCH160 TaxID=3447928 RepID=UPI0039FDD3BD